MVQKEMEGLIETRIPPDDFRSAPAGHLVSPRSEVTQMDVHSMAQAIPRLEVNMAKSRDKVQLLTGSAVELTSQK